MCVNLNVEVVSAPDDVVLHYPGDLLLDALRQAGHGLEPDHPHSCLLAPAHSVPHTGLSNFLHIWHLQNR